MKKTATIHTQMFQMYIVRCVLYGFACLQSFEMDYSLDVSKQMHIKT